MISWICRNEWLCVQLQSRVRWDRMIWHILHTSAPKDSKSSCDSSKYIHLMSPAFNLSQTPQACQALILFIQSYITFFHIFATSIFHSLCVAIYLYHTFQPPDLTQPNPTNLTKRLVKVPSSCRRSSLRPAPSAILRRQDWQPQRKFRRDKRPRRASEGLEMATSRRDSDPWDLCGEWNTYMIICVCVYIYMIYIYDIWKWRSLLKVPSTLCWNVPMIWESCLVGSRCVLQKSLKGLEVVPLIS